MPRTAGSELLVLATQGPGSGDETRITTLLAGESFELFALDRQARVRSASRLLRRLLGRRRPRLLVIEGTGIAGCGPAILAGALGRTPFVVSTGDAVGPFHGLRGPLARLAGGVYERWLYRSAEGVIGWTPYLVGRALSLGAERAITAENWSDAGFDSADRNRVRAALAIPSETVVYGIAGSLTWAARRRYCYGLELVQAARLCGRSDLRVMIVGDGDGLPHLRRAADGDPRIIFTGRVPAADVPAMLSAIDVASLPQSRDAIGSFRYTIKLSEYLASGVRVVTGRLPFAYDLSEPSVERIAGRMPWGQEYVRSLADHMAQATTSPDRSSRVLPTFERERQQVRVRAFVTDVLAELGP